MVFTNYVSIDKKLACNKIPHFGAFDPSLRNGSTDSSVVGLKPRENNQRVYLLTTSFILNSQQAPPNGKSSLSLYFFECQTLFGACAVK